MLDDRDEKLSEPIKFVASPTLKEQIEDATQEAGKRMSVSEWVRQACEEKLERDQEG